MFPLLGAWVLSLVRELRACKLHSTLKIKKKNVGTYFGHKPTKFKTTEARFNLGEETDQASLSVG